MKLWKQFLSFLLFIVVLYFTYTSWRSIPLTLDDVLPLSVSEAESCFNNGGDLSSEETQALFDQLQTCTFQRTEIARGLPDRYLDLTVGLPTTALALSISEDRFLVQDGRHSCYLIFTGGDTLHDWVHEQPRYTER